MNQTPQTDAICSVKGLSPITQADRLRDLARELETENAQLKTLLREVLPDLTNGTTARWKGKGSDKLRAALGAT